MDDYPQVDRRYVEFQAVTVDVGLKMTHRRSQFQFLLLLLAVVGQVLKALIVCLDV